MFARATLASSASLLHFQPSECRSLIAVFADAVSEVQLLLNVSKQDFPQHPSSAMATRGFQSNQDALLTELNKIFFQTLMRYEKARQEDYLELPDGTFRKLNDDESMKVKYLEVVSTILNTLQKLHDELDDYGTFTVLQKYCDEEQSEIDKLEFFVNSASEKEKGLTDLHQDICELEKELEQESIEFSNTLACVHHELQELKEMAHMTLEYSKKEYKNKLQHDLATKTAELKRVNNEIEALKQMTAQETRNSEESRSWLYMNIANLVNYSSFSGQNREPQMMANKLKVMSSQLEAQQNLHAELRTQYEACEAIVVGDQQAKEAERVRNEYTRRYVLAVVQIQSWWRTMIEVRSIKLRKRKGEKKKKGKKGAKK